MPLQHDQHIHVTQGWMSCRPPDENEFVKCFIVLDRPKQLLICYKKPLSSANLLQIPQGDQSGHHNNWPVLKELKTDSISLVEEAQKAKQKFCFAVHSLAKATHFSAESWKDMEEWMECIKNAGKISVDKSCLNPNRKSMVGSYITEVVAGSVIRTPVATNVDDAAPCSNNQDAREDSIGSNSSDCRSLDSSSIQIIRSGYCVKQGAMMKNWKRRYLMLTNDELMYSKNQLVGKPLKRIPVHDIKDVKVSSSEISNVRSNLIDLVTPDRTFYMQFDSVEEMYGWIEDIRKASDLSVMTYL